jgi:hypothetical protein
VRAETPRHCAWWSRRTPKESRLASVQINRPPQRRHVARCTARVHRPRCGAMTNGLRLLASR